MNFSVQQIQKACLENKTKSQGGLNNKDLKHLIRRQQLVTHMTELKELSRQQLCDILRKTYDMPLKYTLEYPFEVGPTVIQAIAQAGYLKKILPAKQLREMRLISKRVKELIESIPEEIYSVGGATPRGWIITEGLEQLRNPESMQIIQFIKEHFFDPNPKNHQYTKNKGLWILRWLGPNCRLFMARLMRGEDPVNGNCFPLYLFLQNFWNSPNLFLFMSIDNSETEIKKDHTLYILRLSTTKVGQITISYWDPSRGKIVHQRITIQPDGGLPVPGSGSKEVAYNIEDFDRIFRETYQSTFNIQIKPIARQIGGYDQLRNAYRNVT